MKGRAVNTWPVSDVTCDGCGAIASFGHNGLCATCHGMLLVCAVNGYLYTWAEASDE